MILIQEYTPKNPITLIGYEAGICYNSDISKLSKNYQRGLDCLKSNHGRALEFVQVYMTIEGYSARCIRELYTHIGGSPTRLQASTRYIDYNDFNYYIPPLNKSQKEIYQNTMNDIAIKYKELLELGVSKEDAANILPLGMMSKIVIRTNLRNLIDIMKVRQCNRAYKEMRDLMREIKKVLSNYSSEWKYLVKNYMPIKCEELGYCPETHGCGYMQGVSDGEQSN